MKTNTAHPLFEKPPVTFPSFQLVVPCLKPEATRAALKLASTLAAGLDAQLRLIDVHVVPHGVPIDKPTVDPQHLRRRIRALALDSDLKVSAEIIYARDWEQGFRRALGPRSLVLMAIDKSWWPGKEKRLAARLRKLGHQVVEC